MHVDDWITGQDTREEALFMSRHAKNIMKEAGMELRKWISNDTALMAQWAAEGFDTYPMDASISLGTNKTKVLGMAWQTLDQCSQPFYRRGPVNTARGGRVRSTTPAEDRYIVLSAKRNRRTTAQQVANQFLAASGKQISRKTVARRLRGGGLYARRPVVCVPLTRQHRTARLQWCREHHNWTEQDWACVLFSDESRFSLSSDCRRQLIWRESGTAYRPENIQEKDRYPTCSIMVWAGIMINGRTHLHVVANGTLTGQRYIDEVLLSHVRLFCGAVGDKFDFMDDNATCHRTLAVQDCLDSEGIQLLVWPARSPDLNPIENVWDALGRKVAGRNYRPTNKNTRIRALTEEWDELPQQLLDNVVQNASKLAYGAAVYLKVRKQNEVLVNLFTSKTKVAPLKAVTLPRLELLRALVAARLSSRVQEIIRKKKECKVFHWTDSKIVLFLIKGSFKRWKQFVANRVQEISKLTDPDSWYHCSGQDNPSDFLSRGPSVDTLISNNKWWNGPAFIRTDEPP
ncbi:transposable element Tc1 transposase [Trichonephila clavipes]|nr:transposable element Tc1 transposase [Trichonephila clavipes]